MKCPNCNESLKLYRVPDVDDPSPGKATTDLKCENCRKELRALFQKQMITDKDGKVLSSLEHSVSPEICHKSQCTECGSEVLEGDSITTNLRAKEVVQEVTCCDCEKSFIETYRFEKFIV